MRSSKPSILTQRSARACAKQYWPLRVAQCISRPNKHWLAQDSLLSRSMDMDSYNSLRNWLDLRGLPVTLPSEGRWAGIVDDFYYKEGTNAVYALRVKTGFLGFKALAASAISTIDLGAVTIANEQMLIDESNGGDLTQSPLGGGRTFSAEEVTGYGTGIMYILDKAAKRL